MSLTECDHAMLAFERRWWKHIGPKEEAIRQQFGLTPTRYYQALNTLIDNPDAHAADPVTVTRLRNTRDTRLRSRRRLSDGAA